MKLAVVGSRNFSNTTLIYSEVKAFCAENNVDTIVSGGALGADTIAKEVAELLALKFTIFKANWGNLGPKAGPVRNSSIAREADVCFAFVMNTLENSKGTSDCVNKFLELKKAVYVFNTNGHLLKYLPEKNEE